MVVHNYLNREQTCIADVEAENFFSLPFIGKTLGGNLGAGDLLHVGCSRGKPKWDFLALV
jgi:hypothetical protein